MTAKANIASGDSIESYSSGDIEIQLSDNDFIKNIKMIGLAVPMSVYSGQNVHYVFFID